MPCAAYLSELIAISNLSGYSAADTTTVNGSSVDMQNYDGVLFIALFGTPGTGNTLKAQSSSDDGSADAFADLAGTSVGVGASDEVVFLDIKHPPERYVRPLALRGASSTLVGIWGFRYGPRSLAIDNTTAGTIHGETHDAPAEGTA